MSADEKRRMTPQRERIVRQQQPGEWLAGLWTIREVEPSNGGRMTWEVLHQGSKQVLATLPDWAGNLALWIAESHEDIPELLTEIDALRARVAELESAAICPSVARLHGSKCVLPVRHRGDHQDETKRHYWSDDYAVPQQRQPEAPAVEFPPVPQQRGEV